MTKHSPKRRCDSQTVRDPRDFRIPFAMREKGEISYGVAARDIDGGGPGVVYEVVAIVVRK